MLRRISGCLVTLLVAQAAAPNGVLAAVRYVNAASPRPLSPYSSWETGSHTVEAAVAVAQDGETVLVTNGTYQLSSTIVITRPLTLTSVNGPDATALDGNNARRCVSLQHPEALVTGLTIRRGGAQSGGGALCTQGTLSDCVVTGNIVHVSPPGVGAAYGGGVHCDGGHVVRCRVLGNSITGYGGGVYCSGGSVENCVVFGNQARRYSVGFGGTDAGLGGGIYMTGGEVTHCSIVRNTQDGFLLEGGIATPAYSGGMCVRGGYVFNTIVEGNSATGTNNVEINASAEAYFFRCCSPELDAGQPVGHITTSADFVDIDSGNLALRATSPCIDRGTDAVSVDVDVDGIPRAIDGDGDGVLLPDIGAYEYHAPVAHGLSCPSLSPRTGLTGDSYRFSVHIGDTNSPTTGHCVVVVDGSPRPLSASGGLGSDFRTDTTILGGGCHSHHFEYTNSGGTSFRLPESGSFSGPFVSSAPALTNGTVSPSEGNTDTTYTYSIDYAPPDGSTAAVIHACVDGVYWQETTLQSGVSTNGTYSYSGSLPAVIHRYYFFAEDQDGHGVKYPRQGHLLGPTVHQSLPIPGDVSVAVAEDAILRLRWSTVADADGYSVWRAETNDAVAASVVAGLTHTTYDDTSVVRDVRYHYWISASNAVTTSSLSRAVNEFVPLDRVVDVAASDGSHSSHVELTWQIHDGAQSYRIWRHTGGDWNEAALLAGTVTTNRYKDTLADHGWTFHYWVQVNGREGLGYVSAPDTGYVAPTPSGLLLIVR
jgi:hypothetical protein